LAETWDVFRSDRLEVERGLGTEQVRAALARGDLHDDDLIRTAGTGAPWARLADLPALFALPATTAEAGPGPEILDAIIVEDDEDEVEIEEDEVEEHDAVVVVEGDDEVEVEEDEDRTELSSVEMLRWDGDAVDDPDAELDAGEFDPLDEDEEAAEFTLSRDATERVEELDLAAMVDVAFQLVLFFLVTATTVLYKSLEVPRPNPETSSAPAAQGKSLEDLKNDFILVEIDPGGAMKVDREPVAATMPALVERLRSARETTGRKSMLLSADSATRHRNAVLAYDAANEIGLSIAIARIGDRR
jgi:biopolymer transport protein ExbD